MKNQYAQRFNLDLRNILIERVVNEGLLSAFDMENKVMLDVYLKYEAFATQNRQILGEKSYTEAMRKLLRSLNKALDRTPEGWWLIYLTVHNNKSDRRRMKEYLFPKEKE